MNLKSAFLVLALSPSLAFVAPTAEAHPGKSAISGTHRHITNGQQKDTKECLRWKLTFRHKGKMWVRTCVRYALPEVEVQTPKN